MAQLQTISSRVLRERYLAAGEHDIEDVQARVARAVASVEAGPLAPLWQRRFLRAMERGLIPGGRINASAGLQPPANLVNCFVQPLGIPARGRDRGRALTLTQAIEEARLTMAAGGGVGYDLGEVPAGDALAALERLDQACSPIRSGHIRGCAQMGLLAIDHPRIRDFITLKERLPLASFNLSVAIDDRFLIRLRTALESGRTTGEDPHDERAIWYLLLQAMLARSEPGVVFIDRVNRDNNLASLEPIRACNPCAEQYLPPYGGCNLASINLTRFVAAPFTDHAWFQWPAFEQVVAVAVRFLDNVLTLNRWPLPQQEQQARLRRRVGLGFTGLADALCMLGLRYDCEQGRLVAATIVRRLRDRAYESSVELAIERGPFPSFDAQGYLRSPSFASRLPETLRRRIRLRGIRNSHLLCIAPTGSISIAFADNCSTGIEPAFRAHYRRWLRAADGSRSAVDAENHAARRWRASCATSDTLPPAWRDCGSIEPIDQLRMVGAVQDFIDSGISKTVQLAPGFTTAQLETLAWYAWRRGLKGFAVFRDCSAPQRVLQPISDTQSAAPEPAPAPKG